MNKPVSLFLLLTFLINFSHAQIVHCGTAALHKMRIETDPQYRAYYENIGQRMEAWVKSKAGARTSDAIITIPVVVHVIYNTSDQNIPDDQILLKLMC